MGGSAGVAGDTALGSGGIDAELLVMRGSASKHCLRRLRASVVPLFMCGRFRSRRFFCGCPQVLGGLCRLLRSGSNREEGTPITGRTALLSGHWCW